MSRFVQALLSGVFFTFILDFFIFLGIQKNYIDFYEIDLYYNILFADNQNIYIFASVSLILGIIITYINNRKISVIFIGTLFILSVSTLIPKVGYLVGEKMFSIKNTILKDSRFTYNGDIYYKGRKKITMYDYELKKVITLQKKDLKND